MSQNLDPSAKNIIEGNVQWIQNRNQLYEECMEALQMFVKAKLDMENITMTGPEMTSYLREKVLLQEEESALRHTFINFI